MRKFKALGEKLNAVWSGKNARETDTRLTDFETFESTDPKHIEVTGTPPLCRNCRTVLSTGRNLGQNTIIAHNIARLKASAQLGCYLCSVLFFGNWTPLRLGQPDLPLLERLTDIDISLLPDLFWCKISQTPEEELHNCFHIKAYAESYEDVAKSWHLYHVMLVPEEMMAVDMSRMLSPFNSVQSVAQQSLSWIEECETMHSTCRQILHSTTWKPTRLIFTGRPDLGQKPRLCLSSNLLSDVTYVTLSHCWGLVKIFQLLSTNLEDLMEELPLSKLTQVFRDAIDLARHLGARYIWIDSLCIMQDSPEDWEYESALMGNIYKNSWCNIAATGFANGLSGIYVKRNPKILKPIKVDLEVRVPNETGDARLFKGPFYCMENYWDADVTQGPLNQRAWFYQERLLSPRVLHLGSRQAFWECCEMESCEAFPKGIPTPMKCHFKVMGADLLLNNLKFASLSSNVSPEKYFGIDISTFKNSRLSIWWKTIQSYNYGGLTKYEDKFIAIAGVAKEIQTCIRDKYIAGFWGEDLVLQLMWTVTTSEATGRSVRGLKSKQLCYQAPSWSWASVNELVENRFLSDCKPIATVLDCKVTMASNSEFGRVKDGYLRIRGRLTRATFRANDDVLRENWADDCELILKTSSPIQIVVVPLLIPDDRVVVPNMFDDGAPSYPVRDAIGSRDFYLLPICESLNGWVGLLLQHTKSGTRGQYSRLGVFVLLKSDEESILSFQTHIPSLEFEDYEEYDEHGFTISII